MKKFNLKKIVLKNFKGQNQNVEFAGDKIIVAGRNGVGKSSLMKAFSWCLSGYTEVGVPKNHELFDNTKELSKDTPAASVRIVFDIDGIESSIERIAVSKWERKRGSTEYTKSSSDTYTLLVDNVEVSNSTFEQWIENNLCPKDMLVYLVSGNFFSTLIDNDKNKARKVLQNIVGEIKPKDFKNDYSLISELVEKFGTQQATESLKRELNPVKEEIIALEGGIKTLEDEISVSGIGKSLQELEVEKKTYEDKIVSINAAIEDCNRNIIPLANERNRALLELSELQRKMMVLRNEYQGRIDTQLIGLREDLKKINERNYSIQSENTRREGEFEANKREIETLRKEVEIYTAKRNTLIAQRDEILQRTFTGDVCTVCGQVLPDEMLLNAREHFDNANRQELEHVVAVGKENTQTLNKIRERIEELDEIIAKGVTYEQTLSTKEIEDEINNIMAMDKFEDWDKYKILKSQMDNLVVPELPQLDLSQYNNDKKVAQEAIDYLNEQIGRCKEIERFRASIDGKKQDIETASKVIATLEYKIDLIKQYEQEKANIIGDRINNKLNKSKIEMFRIQKDGTIVDDCVLCQKNGTKFSTSNNGMKIVIQAELQRLFCEFYGISMPIFVDEAKILDEDKLFFYAGYQTILLMREDCDLTIK